MAPVSSTMARFGLHEGCYEVEVRLSDLQGDTGSSLYSISSFEKLGINLLILKGLYALHLQSQIESKK